MIWSLFLRDVGLDTIPEDDVFVERRVIFRVVGRVLHRVGASRAARWANSGSGKRLLGRGCVLVYLYMSAYYGTLTRHVVQAVALVGVGSHDKALCWFWGR